MAEFARKLKVTGAFGSYGEKGADGKSAYEYAREGGYTGTEEEFATKLAQNGGGVFTVTYNSAIEDPFQCIDKTFDEICEAVESGMYVECTDGHVRYRLVYGSRVSGRFKFIAFVDQTLLRIVIDRDDGVSSEYINDLTSMRWIQVSEGIDGFVSLDTVLTNYDLMTIDTGAAPEVLPYITFVPYHANETVCLSYVGSSVHSNDDGTVYGVYTFSQTVQPVEGREKSMRYTVKLLVETVDGIFDPDGEPLIEYSVEDIEDSLPIATPETLGGVQPVAKSADMTQSVGVDATGRLWTAPSADGSSEVVLINYTAAEPVSMVEIPITEEMKTAIVNANCIRWRLTLSGDETATDTTGYGSADLRFWCGWGAGTLLPTTAESVPSAENKSWAVGNINGYIFKSSAISNLGIESLTGRQPNTVDLHLSCFCKTTGSGNIPAPSFNTTSIRMSSADMVLRLTTSLPIGTGSRIILTVS